MIVDFEKRRKKLDDEIARIDTMEEEWAEKELLQNSLLQSRRELMQEYYNNLTAYEIVQLARRANRAKFIDYQQALFPDFMELSGDRYFGDDHSIVGGIATFHGRTVTIIGQNKGKDLKENIKANFGMSNPEGYRKSLRLMKQAEKFGRPILCFVDTPGAYPGIGAEERGQSEAIARNLMEMSTLKVPVITIVIGEGGSGGALALSVANRILMLEYAVYSILSPEGFASILWKDKGGSKVAEASELMKLTAGDLHDFGFVDRILPEDADCYEGDFSSVYAALDRMLEEELVTLSAMDGEALRKERYEKFRTIDASFVD